MVYEYLDYPEYSFVVKDVDYGSKDQIVYDGEVAVGTSLIYGRLVCDEKYNVVPANMSVWYYRTETDGTITITKIIDPYSNQTLVLEKQVGDMVISQYTKEAFEDLDPSVTVLVDEGIAADVPDRLSKVVVQTEQGEKAAYFTLGTESKFDDETFLHSLRLPIDTSTLYVKDHVVFRGGGPDIGDMAVVSYHEDAQGNVIVDNVLKNDFGEPCTVGTSIEGKPVTTVMINSYNSGVGQITVDPSVNQIIYSQNIYDQDADLTFTSIRQGSGQQAVEIPANMVGEIGESAFDENVQMIIVPEGSRVNAPEDVAQLVYRVDDQGNVIVTDVVAAVDGNGQKQKLDIPDFIAGKVPILSQTVKDKMTQIPHTHIGGTATCAEKAVCTVCGAEYGEPDSANHTNLVKTEAKPATYMTEGNIEYWYCDGCDKYFSNEAGTEEISLEDTVIPKLTEHTADGTGWHSDEISHWNTCECGEKLNEAAHTFEWVIDKEATVTEAGLRHEECTVCGYEKAAVEIPATGIAEDPSEPPTDTNKPSGDQTDNTTSPETGDNSNIALWIVVLLAAGAALTGTVLYSRKRKYSK